MDIQVVKDSDLPFIDDRGNLITGVARLDNAWLFIPARHVSIIYARLKKGLSPTLASPVYPINREQAAYILNNYQED